MFIYLLFFRMARYFGLPTPPGHTNLIQMILTLKLVGLAFERNTFQHKRHIHEGDHKDSEHDSEFGKAMQHLTFIDIFHYCFNFIGVLTGNKASRHIFDWLLKRLFIFRTVFSISYFP